MLGLIERGEYLFRSRRNGRYCRVFARRLLGAVLFFTGRCSPLSFEVDLSKPLMLLASFQGATHGNASRERFFFLCIRNCYDSHRSQRGQCSSRRGDKARDRNSVCSYGSFWIACPPLPYLSARVAVYVFLVSFRGWIDGGVFYGCFGPHTCPFGSPHRRKCKRHLLAVFWGPGVFTRLFSWRDP